MKKETLIKKLQALPDGINVVVVDWRYNIAMNNELYHADFGVYHDIKINLHKQGKKSKPTAMIMFDNPESIRFYGLPIFAN